jgi:hypothetical protein
VTDDEAPTFEERDPLVDPLRTYGSGRRHKHDDVTSGEDRWTYGHRASLSRGFLTVVSVASYLSARIGASREIGGMCTNSDPRATWWSQTGLRTMTSRGGERWAQAAQRQ